MGWVTTLNYSLALLFPMRLEPENPIVVKNGLLYIDFDRISEGVTQLGITRKRGNRIVQI